MQRAINVLKTRIEALNKFVIECEKVMEEPEMMCDYEFARNDAGNAELEIIELNKAIELLLKHPKK